MKNIEKGYADYLRSDAEKAAAEARRQARKDRRARQEMLAAQAKAEEWRCIKDWRKEGFRPRAEEEPRQIKSFGLGRYAELYARSQVVKLRARPVRPPAVLELTPENVLRATWTVNRSAKRYRDAARKCYVAQAFEFATANREKKDGLYALKDAGISWLDRAGAIQPVAVQGGLCVWRGSGFCFHSRLLPKNSALNQTTSDGVLYVEAKPKSAHELRLADASRLLQGLPKPSDDYVRLASPSVLRGRAATAMPDGQDEDDESENNEDVYFEIA